MAKDKVKSHVRRTKKGVARVAGHARNSLKKKGIRADKKGLAITGGVLSVGAIIGGAVALKKGAGKNLLKKHGKKATKTMTNATQEVTSAVGAVPKLTQEQFNKAQKAAMSGGVRNDTLDILSSGSGLTQAQRGVAMVPVSSKALVPVKMNSTSLVTTGATSKKASKGLLRQAMDGTVAAGRATRRAADEAVSLGRQTRSAFDEGYQTHKPSKLSASIGRNLAKLTKAVRSDIQALSQRAKKQRGK